jgi:hypothetical protein
MAMLLISLILGTLAVVRVTRFLIEDRLALRYRVWVRRKWGEESVAAYFVDCPWCTSIWVAAAIMPPAVLFPNPYVIAAEAILAASMVTGLTLDRE